MYAIVHVHDGYWHVCPTLLGKTPIRYMQTESPQTGSGADIKPSLRLAARPSFFLACVWTSWAFRIIVTATARTRRARGIPLDLRRAASP